MRRVECDQCKNFIDIVLKEEGEMFSGIKIKAKCKKGKRVMFRQPVVMYGECGYFRYCDDFKLLTFKLKL